MKKLVLSVVALSIFMVQPAFAQQVKARGSEAITLGAFNNSASIGYWHKLSDANSIGGDFTVHFRDDKRNDSEAYQLSPGIKHYLQPEKEVSPYLYGAVIAEYQKYRSENRDATWNDEYYTAGAQGGIGLEWFPVQSVSVAGHVGVIAEYRKSHNGNPYRGDSGSDDEGFLIGTISSGILLNLYF